MSQGEGVQRKKRKHPTSVVSFMKNVTKLKRLSWTNALQVRTGNTLSICRISGVRFQLLHFNEDVQPLPGPIKVIASSKTTLSLGVQAETASSSGRETLRRPAVQSGRQSPTVGAHQQPVPKPPPSSRCHRRSCSFGERKPPLVTLNVEGQRERSF